MIKADYTVDRDLEPFVNGIMTQENDTARSHTHIPLYADGYPGIMFQQSANGLFLLPRNKQLSELFLYGQTLEPVSLDVAGPFKFIVVQLYPFASKYLLNIDPKVLNDDCFDLLQIEHIDVEDYRSRLSAAAYPADQVGIISDLMRDLIRSSKPTQDDRVQQAIAIILKHKGQVKIQAIREELGITERAFERNFMAQVGLTPKQFARIIQFQYSLHQLTAASFDKLVDVGMDSGFADQSHFIRAFKQYTGQTPSYFLKKHITAR